MVLCWGPPKNRSIPERRRKFGFSRNIEFPGKLMPRISRRQEIDFRGDLSAEIPPGRPERARQKPIPTEATTGPRREATGLLVLGFRVPGSPRRLDHPVGPSCLRRRLLLRRWPETLQDAGPDTADKLMSAFGLSEGAGKLSPPFLRALGLLRSEETAPPFPPHFSTPSLWRRSESPPAPS